MKKYLIYLMSLFAICMLLSACSEKEQLQVVAEREVTLNLNLSTRASNTHVNDSEGTHGTLKVWIFEENSAKTLVYKEYESLRWDKLVTTGEETPEYFTSITERFKLEQNSVKLSVHVVINSESVTDASGALLKNVLNEQTTKTELETCVFNISATTHKCKGNELLIYGSKEVETVLEPDNLFNISLTAKRCLSRLEVYFTQRSENVNLMIKKITLSKRPSGGNLVHPAADALLPTTTEQENSADPVVIFNNDAGQAITTVLGGNISASDFAKKYDDDLKNNPTKPTTFDNTVVLTEPILTERRGVSSYGNSGTEDAYILTVTYDKGSVKNLTEVIALNNVPRNTRYRVFFRASVDTPIQVYAVTTPWDLGMGTVITDITDDGQIVQ